MARFLSCMWFCIALSGFSPVASLMWSLADKQMPMIVHVTSPHDSMPSDMQELWSRNTPFLDGAQVHYYNEERLVTTVQEISMQLEKEAGIRGAWEAFQNLRPGAYRADLWRLLILWSRGGIYLDCDLELKIPITTWLRHSDSSLFLVKDCQNLPGQAGLSWAYWNAMMASTPHHEILEHMIGTIVKNVHAHYYAEDQKWHRPLSITGPRALGMALESYNGSTDKMSQAAVLVSQKRADGRDEPIVQLDGHAIVQHNQAKGLEKDYKLTSAHYDPLFWLHLVYCDEGNIPCTTASRMYLAQEHPRMLAALQTNSTLNETKTSTSTTTTTSTSDSTSSTVTGSMDLTVSDPDAFIASASAKIGVAKGLAQHLGIPVDFVKVEMSLSPERRLKSAMLRRLEGRIRIDYEIIVPVEQSAAHDINAIADKITDATSEPNALMDNLVAALAAEDTSIPKITQITLTPPTIHDPSKTTTTPPDLMGSSKLPTVLLSLMLAPASFLMFH